MEPEIYDACEKMREWCELNGVPYRVSIRFWYPESADEYFKIIEGEKKVQNKFKTRTKAIEFLLSVSWLEQDLATGTFSKKGEYLLADGESARPIYFVDLNPNDQWEIKVHYFYSNGERPETEKLDDDTFQQMYLNRK